MDEWEYVFIFSKAIFTIFVTDSGSDIRIKTWERKFEEDLFYLWIVTFVWLIIGTWEVAFCFYSKLGLNEIENNDAS